MDMRGENYNIRVLQTASRKYNSKSPSSLKYTQEELNVYMINENTDY
jgi:flagellar basal body rod protein FlgF